MMFFKLRETAGDSEQKDVDAVCFNTKCCVACQYKTPTSADVVTPAAPSDSNCWNTPQWIFATSKTVHLVQRSMAHCSFPSEDMLLLLLTPLHSAFIEHQPRLKGDRIHLKITALLSQRLDYHGG